MQSMAAASPSPAFEIKSASLPLVAFQLKTCDLAQLAEELRRRVGDAPDFFEDDPVVIDLVGVEAEASPLDVPALLHLLREHKMRPVAVRGGSQEQQEAARSAGLAPAAEVVTSAPERVREVVREVVQHVPVPATPAAAMIVDKPLRSGQQVYAKGGDLVVLAAVNFGAEVIADGHIHVYAPLRGRVIAGARGNTDARIFTTCLEPELIAIAGIYRTTETAIPEDVAGKPAQVRLVGEKLVMEPLKFS
ncbi:MAG TPA: septum site-determining protein MinC [Burkholderiaceae bacterium]|nr:septum site-determining protein MinC [Burkholderiaceae bacterium]